MHAVLSHPTTLAAAALIVALGATPLTSAWAQGSSDPLSLNIAAQPLSKALDELARQAGVRITYPAATLDGKPGVRVSGPLTLRQALDRLLAGQGLTAAIDAGVVVISDSTATGGSAREALARITVSGSAQREDAPMRTLKATATPGALGGRAVLDTPFSVTVVDSAEIAERSVRSIGQLFVNDPGVYTLSSSLSTDWWGTEIRGLDVRNYYVDDIPMLLYWGGDFPLEAVESVSALKGLTGFMYGFGDPGGALSYRLKRPKTADETTVSINYRNPNLVSLHVDTSQRLGDAVAIRANLATEHGTGYNSSKIDRTLASLAADARLGSAVTLFGTLMYEKSRNEGEPLMFYIDSYDFAASNGRLPSVTYRYDDINVDNAYYETQTKLAITGARWQINDHWRATYQLGFSRKDHLSNKAFAYLLNEQGDYSGEMYNFAGRLDTSFTQLMLQGHLQWGATRHEIVAGAGVQRSKDRWGTEWYWENDFNGNLYQQQTFRVTRTPDFSLAPLSTDNRQTYAFLSDTVDLGEHWQAIVGVRHTNYRAKDLDGDPAVDSGYAVSKASPTLALIYKPDAGTRVYGSYVESLEPGTRVAAPYANAGELLGATISKQLEVGVKRAVGSLQYAAALFRVERANQMDVVRGTDRFLTQDGRVNYHGVELSSAWQVDKQLNVGFGVLRMEGDIAKVSPENAAFEGHTPGFMSRMQTVINAQYRVNAVPGLKLHGNVRRFGSVYTSDANTWRIPGRTVASAGFGYDFKVGNQQLTLVGNVFNLFNARYMTDGNPGEARNAALGLSATF